MHAVLHAHAAFPQWLLLLLLLHVCLENPDNHRRVHGFVNIAAYRLLVKVFHTQNRHSEHHGLGICASCARIEKRATCRLLYSCMVLLLFTRWFRRIFVYGHKVSAHILTFYSSNPFFSRCMLHANHAPNTNFPNKRAFRCNIQPKMHFIRQRAGAGARDTHLSSKTICTKAK